jgi:uncharacterized membrane protein YecN with MAPEG domain
LLLTVLYVRVSQRRLAVKIGVGTGGDAELEQRVRAHGNLIEAAPFVLILLYLVERTALDPIFIHAFGATFLLARLAHAQGISSTTGRSTGRFVGSLATVLILAALSVILVARSVSVLPVNS